MSYTLRFVQRFREDKRKEFMELEKEFIKLEQAVSEFPKGKRSTPYSGREPVNTLIWECEFPSLEEAQNALSLIENHPAHEKLYQQQVQCFLEAYVEIYKTMEA